MMDSVEGTTILTITVRGLACSAQIIGFPITL